MNNHFISVFSVAFLAMPLNAFAQLDTEGVGTVSNEVFPVLTVVESKDGGRPSVVVVGPTETVPVLPLDASRRYVTGAENAISAVMVTGDNENVVDGFVMQNGGEVFAWNHEIIDSLNLTTTQRDEIQNAMKGTVPQNLQGESTFVGNEDIGQRIGKMRESVNKVLTLEQRTRFSEVNFQLAGGLESQFLNDQMLEHLGLTSAQKEQIKIIATNREAETLQEKQKFDSHKATQEERKAFNFANAERVKKYAEQVKAVLTPEQKAKAEKLTAEIPTLREKLGMFSEELAATTHNNSQTQTEQVSRGQQQATPRVYTPGPNSWRPGMPLPSFQTPLPERPRRFPRSEDRKENSEEGPMSPSVQETNGL